MGDINLFLGQFNHTIDAKGRLIIPSKYREELGENFIISKGYDECLYALDMDSFEEQFEKIKALPQSLKETRRLKRFYFDAVEAEYDKQGRVLIPANLRAFAGLEKDVVLLGVGDKVEIWSAEKLESMDTLNIEDDAEALAKMGYDI